MTQPDRRGLGEMLADRITGPAPAAPVDDPVAWIEARFGVALWSKQAEVVRAVLDNRYTAVRAAHSVGKSKVAALLMGFWIASKPPGSAFVFSTAPRTAQVRAILWRELSRAHRVGNLPGCLSVAAQVPEWWIGDELVGVGRKPADLADPETAATSLQGIHAEYLLCVLDESAGLAPWVWDAVDSLASNAGARVVALGNPTVRESRFFEVSQPGSGWHRIVIPATASPAFTGESVPDSVLRNLVSREWVEERKRRWGLGSPMYKSRVEAEFPTSDDNALVEPAWVEAAQSFELRTVGAPVFGCDVARGGADQTVIVEALGAVEGSGKRLRIRHRVNGHDTMQTAGKIGALLIEAGEQATAQIDAIGLGVGTFDRCRELGLAVRAYVSSERAQRPDKFRNRRAESFWMLRELLRNGEIDLPDDEDLAAQLLALRWSMDSSGRIGIETKEQIKARGLPSPDLADAAAMAVGGPPPQLPVIVQPSRAAGGLNPWSGQPDLPGSLTGDLMEKKW